MGKSFCFSKVSFRFWLPVHEYVIARNDPLASGLHMLIDEPARNDDLLAARRSPLHRVSLTV